MKYIRYSDNLLTDSTKKGIGISIPFNNTNVFKSTYTTKDSLRNNIINFLLTNNRERIMNPRFGTNIRNNIFENLKKENLNNIKIEINDYIINEFKNIIISLLEINTTENSINIYIKYIINDSNIEDDMELTINKNE